MVSLGGPCQSRVLIHSFENIWSLGRKEGLPEVQGEHAFMPPEKLS